MDPKNRVSIPVDFRPDEEGEVIRLLISKEYEMPVIKVYSDEVFEDKFRQIGEAEISQAKKNNLIGRLRMMSKQATISSQGKLTVPKDWAEKIGLKADGPVKLGGRGPHYIICTDETFNRISDIENSMDDDGLGVL